MSTIDFILLVSGITVTGGLAGLALFHSVTGARPARELAGEWMLAVGSGLAAASFAGSIWLGLTGSALILGGLAAPARRLLRS